VSCGVRSQRAQADTPPWPVDVTDAGWLIATRDPDGSSCVLNGYFFVPGVIVIVDLTNRIQR
jgi:hypothetical protein